MRPNDPVQIGSLTAVSGEAAVFGEDQLRGVELAISEQNGTVLDHEVELINVDTGCQRAATRRATQELLATDNLVAIIGPTCSDEVWATLPLLEESGVTLIASSTTSLDLTAVTSEPDTHFFRTAPGDVVQAQVAARFAYDELDARTAVTVTDGSSYAQAMQQAFAIAFTQAGGRLVDRGEIIVGQTVIDDALGDMLAANPDVVFVPLFAPEAGLIANELADADNPDTVLIGTDALLLPEFATGTGSAVEGTYLAGTAVSGTAYAQYLARWDAAFSDTAPGPYHAHAYDATTLLLTALAQAAVQDNNGALLIGRQALRDAVADTAGLAGLTGTLTCNAGECASDTAIGIYQITPEERLGRSWPPPLIWNPPTTGE